MDQLKTYQISNNKVYTYCSKCLSKLNLNVNNTKYVKDHNGYLFCDAECRMEYYAEIGRDMDSNFNEWIDRD